MFVYLLTPVVLRFTFKDCNVVLIIVNHFVLCRHEPDFRLGLVSTTLIVRKIYKLTYSSVLHSHTVLMKVCPCGRYRQLNSVLYPNILILKSSKIISNGLVLKYV